MIYINIILIGMPFSGKTTIGEFIATKNKLEFIDTDFLIEHLENMTITDIFRLRGEKYFRIKEKEILKDLKMKEDCIIDTGGGMPIYEDNMKILQTIGCTIFLDTPLEILIQRAKECSDRPLVKNNPEKDIVGLYKKRYNIYKRAKIHIVPHGNLESIYKDIMNNICK